MADFVKKKIVEKLARFTKNLNPNDISLSFLKGKGELNNLDLNAEFLTDVLRLPPWIRVKSVFCDQIKIDVPFTDLQKKPIRCILHTVIIEVSTCDDDQDGDRERSDIDLKKLSSSSNSSSSYGLTEKIIDGMKVEIGAVQVHFANPVFKANLEMTDVVIESTTPQWTPDILPHCRHKNNDEGSVIIYKKCTWSSLKVEGFGVDINEGGDSSRSDPIRLMASMTEIRVTVKRRMNDCKVLYTRVTINLGDLSWVLTQEHLKSISLLVQSLTEAAVKWNQKEREKMALMRGSRDSLDSVGSSGSLSSVASRDKDEVDPKKIKRTKSPTKNKELMKETSVRNRELTYQLGQANLPPHEVIQDSIHIKSGSLNLQICDGNGSLLLQVNKLIIDIYLDQLATTGRCHWNKANVKLHEAAEWSSGLVKTAEKIQFVDLPSINLYKLRERGIVIRCSDFSIRSEDEDLLPIISCDNKTFSLPNDIDNPAFQFVICMYFYPLEEGHRFLVPRPNIYGYLAPVHANIHQQLFLWLAEFVHGVLRTVNLSLLLSASTEGKMFVEEIKAKRDTVQQLPGIDIKFYVPYIKVTIPSDCSYTDNRPRAVQVETGGVYLENHSLLSILSNSDFLSAWERCRTGWLSNTPNQFPNNANDASSMPTLLVELIEKELKAKKTSEASPKSGSSSNRSSSLAHLEVPTKKSYGRGNTGRRSAPDISHHKMSLHQLSLLTIEVWCCHTRCVNLSFVSDLTHEATLYTKEFVHDFPIQLWLFQPKKIAEVLSPSHSPNTTESSTNSAGNDALLPVVHVLLDIPKEVEVKLERLHFLFLMRLKDSFQGFKNKLMQYLTLDSLLQSQDTEAFHINKDSDSLDSPCDMDDTDELKVKLTSAFKMADKNKNSNEKKDDKEKSSLVTAGVSVQGIKVLISLPSLGPVLKSPKQGSPALSNSYKNGSSKASSSSASSLHMVPSQTKSVSKLKPLTTQHASPLEQQTANKTQSMPHLTTTPTNTSTTVLQMGHTETRTIEHHSPTSVSLSESQEEFVFVMSNKSRSQSPNSPMELIPETAIEANVTNSSSKATNVSVAVDEKVSRVKSISLEPTTESSSIPNGSIPSFKSEELLTTSVQSNIQVPAIVQPAPSPANSSLLLTPTHSLYVNTGKLKVLLTLSDQGIALRTTVDTVLIEELTSLQISEMERKQTSRRKPVEPLDDVVNPVIKARVQLGKSVNEYFSTPATMDATTPPFDGVVFLKVSGLKVVLGIKNLMAVKDFFDDEKESDTPIPIQLRIVETQLTIKDQLSFPLIHPKNATVNIPDIFINRGPRANGTNLIQSDSSSESSSEDKQADKTDQTNPLPVVVETVVSSNETTDKNASAELLKLFHNLMNAFQTHTSTVTAHSKLAGNVVVSQPEKVGQLLEELGKMLSLPHHSYNDTLSCDFYSNISNSTTSSSSSSSHTHPTIDSLRAEVEVLRADNKKLQLELVSAREEQANIVQERDEVTRELVDNKVKLASAHLVMEQQIIKMERLYSENCNLKDKLGE